MTARSSMIGSVSTRVDMVTEPEVDETFKTGIDFPNAISIPSPNLRTTILGPINEQDLYKLPPVVNFVALRETFLSEAPFVKRTNRAFWKKWIDSKQYTQSFAVLLRQVTNCINDNGAINIGRLYDIEGNILIEKLSSNIAEMLTLERDYLRHSVAHDVLFGKLPEVLAYMIINSLQSTLPKLTRVYYSGQFRELLLDWLNELIGGIRLTNPRVDREWLFHDASEIGIVLLNQGSMRQNRLPSVNEKTMRHSSLERIEAASQSNKDKASNFATDKKVSFIASSSGAGNMDNTTNTAATVSTVESSPTPHRKTIGGNKSSSFSPPSPKMSFFQTVLMAHKEEKYKQENDMTRFSRATSAFVLENSPLVKMHLNAGRNTEDFYTCLHPLKISMSHVPDRPLFSLQPEVITKEGTFREKKIDRKRLQYVLKQSTQRRQQIMKDVADREGELKKDIQRMRNAYQVQLDILNKKPVTRKQLLAAATSFEASKATRPTSDDEASM